MIRILKVLAVLLGLISLSSCSTSNSVVSNRLVQKRKYNSGWFIKINSQKNKKSPTSEVTEKGSFISLKKTDKSDVILQPFGYNESTAEDISNKPLNVVSASLDSNLPLVSDKITYQKRTSNLQLNEDVVLIESRLPNQIIVQSSSDNPKEKNKVAVYSFATFLASILFIAIGFAMIISSETFFMLIFGVALLLASIILSILALTKYKHLEKRKVFAKITLYTIIFAPLLTIVISLLWLATGGEFSYSM